MKYVYLPGPPPSKGNGVPSPFYWQELSSSGAGGRDVSHLYTCEQGPHLMMVATREEESGF